MKIVVLLFLLILLTFAEENNGWYYNSSFGFKASNIPKNWVVVTKESTHKNFKNTNFNILKTFDKKALNTAKKLINSGEIESLYYKKYNEKFNNIIFVSAENRTVPLLLKKSFLCNGFESDLQKAFNRKDVKLYSCKIQNIYGKKILTYVHDGALIGTKSMGYIFNTDKRMIRFILTCDNKYCPIIQKETELIFKNLSFNKKNIISKVKVAKRLKVIKKFLENEFCKEKSFFRECLPITQEECHLRVKKHLDTCAKKNINIFYDAENYKHIGQIIGRCTGEKMGGDFNNKLKNIDKCNNWKF